VGGQGRRRLCCSFCSCVLLVAFAEEIQIGRGDEARGGEMCLGYIESRWDQRLLERKTVKKNKKKVLVHENSARWVVGFEVGSDQASTRGGSGT
jgi:hypothetical protein